MRLKLHTRPVLEHTPLFISVPNAKHHILIPKMIVVTFVWFSRSISWQHRNHKNRFLSAIGINNFLPKYVYFLYYYIIIINYDYIKCNTILYDYFINYYYFIMIYIIYIIIIICIFFPRMHFLVRMSPHREVKHRPHL